MNCYEAVFILGQDLTTKNVNEIVDGYAQYITKNGGEIITTEYWGLRSLAYQIQKSKKAHYVMLGIKCSGEAINELVKKANLREDILRFMPIEVKEVSKEPSQMVDVSQEDKPEKENKKTNEK